MGSISGTGIDYAGQTRGWRHSTRLRRAALALAFAPLLIGALAPAELVVEVRDLRSTNGLVHLCLTRDPAHFPDCQGDRQSLHRTVPAAQAARITLSAASGQYALALVHDENGNGRLDTFLGIPREGYGFSRDAPVRFGPPRFDAARFTLQGRQSMVVHMRYIF